MMPAEPGALISYTRTQICTFCQSGGGFPTEKRGWVSQNLHLKYKWKSYFPQSNTFCKWISLYSRYELFNCVHSKINITEASLKKSLNDSL